MSASVLRAIRRQHERREAHAPRRQPLNLRDLFWIRLAERRPTLPASTLAFVHRLAYVRSGPDLRKVWGNQVELGIALGYSDRTVRRHRHRCENHGALATDRAKAKRDPFTGRFTRGRSNTYRLQHPKNWDVVGVRYCLGRVDAQRQPAPEPIPFALSLETEGALERQKARSDRADISVRSTAPWVGVPTASPTTQTVDTRARPARGPTDRSLELAERYATPANPADIEPDATASGSSRPCDCDGGWIWVADAVTPCPACRPGNSVGASGAG